MEAKGLRGEASSGKETGTSSEMEGRKVKGAVFLGF